MTSAEILLRSARFLRFFAFMLLAPALVVGCSNLRGGIGLDQGSELLLAFIWEALCLAVPFLLCLAVPLPKWRRALLAAAGVAVGLFNSADLLIFVNSHAQFSPTVFLQAGEVNIPQFCGLVVLHLLRWTNLIVPLYWALGLTLLFVRRPRKVRLVLPAGLGLAALLGFSGAIMPCPQPEAPLVKTFPDMFFEYLDECVSSDDVRASIAMNNKDLKAVNSDRQAVYMLVIGESHSKRHSSLYGYPRKTMPEMEALRDAGELVVFSDAVSPNSFTCYVVPRLLSFASHESGVASYETQNVFDIMNAAGFKTFWLGNQSGYDSRDPQCRGLSERASVRRVGPGGSPDSCLMPMLDAALEDSAPKKFIVLHLWGSHFDYSRCYPQGFGKFKEDENPPFFNAEQSLHKAEINCYDNSVLFNDSILGLVVSKLKAAGGKSFMLYLSDHGENLYELKSVVTHMDFMPTRYSAEIPMLLWMSDGYKRELDRTKLDCVLKSGARPCDSDDIINAVIDLAGVATPRFEQEKSVVNLNFVPKRRIVSNDGLDYERLLASDPDGHFNGFAPK